MIRFGNRAVRGFGLGAISAPASSGATVLAALAGAGAGVGTAVFAHKLGAQPWEAVAGGVGTAIGVAATVRYFMQPKRPAIVDEPGSTAFLLPAASGVIPGGATPVTGGTYAGPRSQTPSGNGGPAVVRQSVIDAWIPFNTAQLTWTDADGTTHHSPDEGVVPWMYCDILGYVTTGMGILIEEGGSQGTDVRNGGTASTGGHLTEQGLRAGWKRADGSLANDDEIQAEFTNIKAHAQEYAQSGHTGVQYMLHLDNGIVNENGPSVQALTATKLQGFADTLKSQLVAFDSFCADGQMGLLSHSWAMGAWLGGWPKMKAAANQTPPDWTAVSQEDVSPTYAPARQASNIRCYLNAEGVDQRNLDPAVLYFPASVAQQGVA